MEKYFFIFVPLDAACKMALGRDLLKYPIALRFRMSMAPSIIYYAYCWILRIWLIIEDSCSSLSLPEGLAKIRFALPQIPKIQWRPGLFLPNH